MRHLELIADGVIAAVKEHVSGVVSGLIKRLETLEQRTVQDGAPGAKGDRGEQGERGEKGMDGADGAVGPQGEAGPQGPEGPMGPPGKDGNDGASGKDGRDGIDGKSVTVDDLRPLLDLAFAKWETEMERRAQEVFQTAIEKMPKPKDGVDGLGFDDMMIQDDGHGLVTLSFWRGAEVKTHEMQIPWPEDRGVWKAEPDEGPYRRGNGVTWDGSWFIAQRDQPQGKPGESDHWRLAVKRGREGKQGAPGRSGEPGKPGTNGRDLTQLGFAGDRH